MKYIQNFRTVGFSKLLDGEEYYNFTSLNNSEKTLIYRPQENSFYLLDYGRKGIERKGIEVRPEAKGQFLSARKSFQNNLCKILKNDGTFRYAKSEHCLIAYRREQRADCRAEKYMYDRREHLYRFILFLGNQAVLQYLCTVGDLLERFDFTYFTEGAFLGSNNYDAVKKGNFPLYLSAEKHDRYLYLAIRFLAGIATQEEADEAAFIDGRTRFVPEEKVYGAGVIVSDVKQIHPSLFARSERYSCAVTIDSRKWQAVWCPGWYTLLILQYTHHVDARIKISDEVYDSIQKQAVKKYCTLP